MRIKALSEVERKKAEETDPVQDAIKKNYPQLMKGHICKGRRRRRCLKTILQLLRQVSPVSDLRQYVTSFSCGYISCDNLRFQSQQCQAVHILFQAFYLDESTVNFFNILDRAHTHTHIG